jgi:hypothetical protein
MEKSNAEPIFQPHSPSVLSIDGSAMKALKVACDVYTKRGKDLLYLIEKISHKTNTTQNDSDDIYIVTFMGKLLPGKRGLGTANRIPGSATYFISKERWEIIKEQGMK